MRLFSNRNGALGAAVAMATLAGAAGPAAAGIDTVVPDDLQTLQLAVNLSVDVDGDGLVTILVRRGTYAENLLISQRIDLVIQGEDVATTIIFGTGPSPTVQVDSSIGVAITNFTITGDGSGDGVVVSGSQTCLVQGNVVQQNARGIELSSAGGSVVADNLVRLNDSDGIVLNRSNGNQVQGNRVERNGASGIKLGRSGANRIEDNVILVNADFGILVQMGNSNLIQFNQISRNGSDGLRVQQASKTIIRDNTSFRNGANGLRMITTQNSQVNRNAITSNVRFGVLRQDTSNDDWNITRSGVQNPPGDNRVVGNRAGNVKTTS